jgi:putative phosphoribosyl transferase
VRPCFADRADAGRALAERLAGATAPGTVVLGLPRGGVVVAAEVAGALGAPLDALPVRKLGLPGSPELAMGAIAAIGDVVETVRTEDVLEQAGVDDDTFDGVRTAELDELRRRESAYRAGRPPPDVRDRAVLIVDDGLATGATMRAAVAAVRRGGAARVVVAVPVGSPRACADLALRADQVVCLVTPVPFRAVGPNYARFGDTTDDEVRAALQRSALPPG